MRATGRVSGVQHCSSVVTNRVELRSILLATDFAEFSARALAYAVGIASRYESQLYLYHCIDPAPYSLAEPDVVWKTRDDIKCQLEHVVLDFHRQGRARNIEVKVVAEVGDVATFLPQAVKDLDPSLVVVGTHGRNGWQKMVLGSVAEIVMDHVSCPVLSVGPSAHRKRLQAFGPQNILLVSEASMRSQLAESYAFSLAHKYGSRLTVVDVLKNRSGRDLAQVSQAKCCDTEQTDVVPDRELTHFAQSSPEVGSQSDFVLQVADRTQADLIVLTVSNSHRFTDRFVSTNSYRVVSGAPCPVLTVHAS